jgi:cyclase
MKRFSLVALNGVILSGGRNASLVPIIASGGAGNLEHLYEAVVKGKAKTLLVASIFHFRKYSIREAKEYLRKKGISVDL